MLDMRYLALACDYDGTVARSDKLAPEVASALGKLRKSGRRAVLVTGRTFEELVADLPDIELFDALVLENGGVLHWPRARETTPLCPSPSRALLERLAARGVSPLISGSAIIATRRPNEIAVLEAIRDLGLELQIIFNGDAVMVLPGGVNKGFGLSAALRKMGLSPHEVVGIGDGENDHSFLDLCECSAAVANAVPAIKAKVDFSTAGEDGKGVAELIEELITTDLSNRQPGGSGALIVLGTREDGTPVHILPYGQNLLVSGPSGAGKSTFATGMIERLIERRYQVCIIDPEGDYETVDDVVTIGNRLRAPQIEEVLDMLSDPGTNLVVNLLGVPLSDRPELFGLLFRRLQAMRARTGRPHWFVVDEAHHVFPAAWGLTPSLIPHRLGETILITYRPREVAMPVLALADVAVAVGPKPEVTLADFASALGIPAPPASELVTARDEVIVWQRSSGLNPIRVKVVRARSERLRHLRKYAEGNLGPRSFVFRGPERRLKLRASNLVSFCEIAAGVDESTWAYHLHAGHYSQWMSRVIKDPDLAREVAAVERRRDLAHDESLRLVRDAIDRRYMLPTA